VLDRWDRTAADGGKLYDEIYATARENENQHRRGNWLCSSVGRGLFLSWAGQDRALIGLLFVLTSLPVFIWGCLNYAAGKGYSKWVDLVGVAGIIGLIVLMVLPDQHEELRRNA
jgi:hypothetical protein